MRNRTYWLLLAAVALAVAAEVAIGAQPREAARIVDVRVGRHAGFVRVVFETDVPAAFEVEGGDGRELRVRLAAESGALLVGAGGGGGPRVTVEPVASGGSLARIFLAAPVRLEQQVLDRPPRIVLDLRPAAAVDTGRTESAAPGLEAATADRPAPEDQAEADVPAPSDAAGEAMPGPPDTRAEAAPPAPAEPAAAEGLPEEPAPPAAEGRLAVPAPPAPAATAQAPPPVSAPPASARPASPHALWPLLLGAGLGLAVGLLIGLSRRRPAAAAAAPSRATQRVPEPAAQPDELRAHDEAATRAEIPREPPPLVAVAAGTAPAPEPQDEPETILGSDVEPEGTTEAEALTAPAAEEEAPTPPAPAAEEEAPAAAAALDADFVSDLLQMLHKLDRRLARLEASFDTLREQSDRLHARSADQGEELVGQRVALTRLARELRAGSELPPPRRAAGGRG